MLSNQDPKVYFGISIFRTALIFACQMSRFDVVALLLQNGADPNIISDNGESVKNVCTNPEILNQLMTTFSGGLLKMSNQTNASNTLHQSHRLDYSVNVMSPKKEPEEHGIYSFDGKRKFL